MNYIGEHLWLGQAGHIFNLVSFVASVVATIAFFFGGVADPNDPNAAESKATRAALQTDSKALAKKLAKDDTLRQQAIDSLGLTPAQQKLMADDKSRYMTLAEAIVFKANGGQNPLGYQKDPITGEQTLDPVGEEGGVNNQGNYKPEPSGYLYGADLTAEAAITKSMFALANLPKEAIRNFLATAVVGELS